MTHVLHTLVFPLDRDPDLLPLYIDAETWSTIDDEPVRVTNRAHIGDVQGRHAVRVRGGRRLSFATYFNAFPAAYWQHWTPVRDVALTVETTGRATILLYRSTGGAAVQRVDVREVEGEATTTFEARLDQFGDGGWLWFDIVADREDVVVTGARWTTEEEPARTGKASLGITTFNKPDYCVTTLNRLAESSDVLPLVDRIFLVDQGTDLVADQPGFDDVAAALGDTLQVVRQPNLGGSGGFARAMHESLDRPDTDFVQLLDDDVDVEPESLRRSIVFGRFTTEPTLVGAHMFDLRDRPKLHAWAEVLDDRPFMWRNLFQEVMPHDFSTSNLRQTSLLHMRMDADYNGWWMCLIPTSIIREIGLPLPAFIKWDDAEYSLRARDAGYATVSMPGVALWHMSWIGKDDSIDWQAYFHARNRFVAALLHSRSERGGTLLRHSRRVDLKHLMMMQYYPTTLRARAVRDVLRGPEHMWENLATAMPGARELAKTFPETTVHVDPHGGLRSTRGRQVFPRLKRNQFDSPTGIWLRLFTARTLLTHWFRDASAASRRQPQVEYGKGDAQWWRLPSVESALVTSADGRGKNIYVRDRAQFRRLLVRSFRLHRRVGAQWDALARRYRAALPELTSRERWAKVFDEAGS